MKEQKKTAVFRLRNDIIFIISLLAISAAGLFYLFVLRDGGNVVKVMVDGKEYGTYSLSQNISQDIQTGENLNRFVIKDGKVYMEKATCPDGICVAHRPVFRDGESIVCLPNRVVVTVETEDGREDADIIA